MVCINTAGIYQNQNIKFDSVNVFNSKNRTTFVKLKP